jgi:hypothetical protein
VGDQSQNVYDSRCLFEGWQEREERDTYALESKSILQLPLGRIYSTGARSTSLDFAF